MPLGLLAELTEISHLIEARERLEHIMDIAAGTGHLKRNAHRRHLRDLRHQWQGPDRSRGADEITRSEPDTSPAAIASLGIELVVLKGVKTAPWPTAGAATDG